MKPTEDQKPCQDCQKEISRLKKDNAKLQFSLEALLEQHEQLSTNIYKLLNDHLHQIYKAKTP